MKTDFVLDSIELNFSFWWNEDDLSSGTFGFYLSFALPWRSRTSFCLVGGVDLRFIGSILSPFLLICPSTLPFLFLRQQPSLSPGARLGGSYRQQTADQVSAIVIKPVCPTGRLVHVMKNEELATLAPLRLSSTLLLSVSLCLSLSNRTVGHLLPQCLPLIHHQQRTSRDKLLSPLAGQSTVAAAPFT